MKSERKPPGFGHFLEGYKDSDVLDMKRTMKMNRKNKKKKKAVVNVPTKMNMKKSIEANTKSNRRWP
jgi:hypothetical protein